MENLLQTILEPMLEHPEDLEISSEETKYNISYKISVHSDDTGRVIGKRGRVIKAIRIIMSNTNHENSKKVFVDVD
ncbi:KH domain-containing protein [Salinicoccus halitifaciens]|uniref:RNA-binding protein KhpA n=1 Tax=Salinicoccus halitifaciens TaxID=1073415 RepID=A0ABV2E944_9STAP|nr:KH domain-containing protein [Salinicoccus halitifaciens]MCD2136645.1 KH domain-containing protein [Salinicoccus halitifaciens]